MLLSKVFLPDWVCHNCVNFIKAALQVNKESPREYEKFIKTLFSLQFSLELGTKDFSEISLEGADDLQIQIVLSKV